MNLLLASADTIEVNRPGGPMHPFSFANRASFNLEATGMIGEEP